MSDNLYKILNPQTGEFSTGGNTPGWSKTGKVWAQIGHLSNHITQLDPYGKRRYRDVGAEVVTIEQVVLSREPIEEYLAASVERAATRKQKEDEQRQRWIAERELRELERLQAKYGSTG